MVAYAIPTRARRNPTYCTAARALISPPSAGESVTVTGSDYSASALAESVAAAALGCGGDVLRHESTVDVCDHAASTTGSGVVASVPLSPRSVARLLPRRFTEGDGLPPGSYSEGSVLTANTGVSGLDGSPIRRSDCYVPGVMGAFFEGRWSGPFEAGPRAAPAFVRLGAFARRCALLLPLPIVGRLDVIGRFATEYAFAARRCCKSAPDFLEVLDRVVSSTIHPRHGVGGLFTSSWSDGSVANNSIGPYLVSYDLSNSCVPALLSEGMFYTVGSQRAGTWFCLRARVHALPFSSGLRSRRAGPLASLGGHRRS